MTVSPTFLLNISLALYLVSSILYLVSLSRFRVVNWAFICLATGFTVHLAATILRYLDAGYTPITNLHESLSFFALCLAGFFIYLKIAYRASILGIVVLPVLSALMVFALSLPSEIGPLPPVLQSVWLPIHTVFAFIGNAVFLMGFLVSIIYLGSERCIKHKKAASILPDLPSLETLDLINYKCMSLGFPLLTIGIISGSIWAEYAWGSYWSWDPKETWSLITWIVYAILIHNRLVIGWRGRKTAYMMILGFISVLVTFLGVNFFIGGLHSYV
jgi:cytochrome c-type biogenesis protein CcsB